MNGAGRVQEFLDQVAEVLEVPSVGPEDDFRQVPLWSSLAAFGILTMLEQRYGLQLGLADLQAARTVRDLAKRAGVGD